MKESARGKSWVFVFKVAQEDLKISEWTSQPLVLIFSSWYRNIQNYKAHESLTRKNMLVDAFGNWLFTLLLLPLVSILLIQNFGLEFVTSNYLIYLWTSWGILYCVLGLQNWCRFVMWKADFQRINFEFYNLRSNARCKLHFLSKYNLNLDELCSGEYYSGFICWSNFQEIQFDIGLFPLLDSIKLFLKYQETLWEKDKPQRIGATVWCF